MCDKFQQISHFFVTLSPLLSSSSSSSFIDISLRMQTVSICEIRDRVIKNFYLITYASVALSCRALKIEFFLLSKNCFFLPVMSLGRYSIYFCTMVFFNFVSERNREKKTERIISTQYIRFYVCIRSISQDQISCY